MSPAARGVKRTSMPFVSGKLVPSNRAWVILTDGLNAGNESVTSTTGVKVACPLSVTIQFTLPVTACALNVPFAQSRQPSTLVPALTQRWVVPCGERVTSFTATWPAPSLVNEIVRLWDDGASSASSLSPTNVSVALLAGFGVAEGEGETLGEELPDGDADSLTAGDDGATEGEPSPIPPLGSEGPPVAAGAPGVRAIASAPPAGIAKTTPSTAAVIFHC